MSANSKSNLAEKALLIKLHIRGWSGTKNDKDVERHVSEWANCEESAGRYIKRLLSKEALAPIVAAAGEARTLHYRLTMPWDDGAYRLLPNQLLEEYERKMDALIEKRIEARNTLVANYRRFVDERRRQLGNLYRPEEYPTEDWLRDRITMAYSVSTVPDTRHFVADLSEKQAAKIRRDIEKRLTAQIETTVTFLWKRLGSAIEQCAERLAPTEDGKPKIFRDSIFEYLRETAATIPKLNLTGDQALNTLAKNVQKLLADIEDYDTLRERKKSFDSDAHGKVKSQLDDMKQRFAGYFAAPVPTE